MRHIQILFIFLFFLAFTNVQADTLTVKEGAPHQYTVVAGDSLWSISSRFFKQPWLWKKIWKDNPHIKNPNLIYPGNVITLQYDATGNPYLSVSNTPQGRYIKLSPSIRLSDIQGAIPIIPVDAIQHFLIRPSIVPEDILSRSPYILDNQYSRLLSGAGDEVYVRGIKDDALENYIIIRKDKHLKDPVTKEIIAYKSTFIGEADLKTFGDPSTVIIAKTVREVLRGDRLLPLQDDDILNDFYPVPPPAPVEGYIIELINAISQIGQYDIAVLNLGQREGVVEGTVLATYNLGRTVYDKYALYENKAGEQIDRRVKLPDERSGLLLVFKSFERISYAIIVESTTALHKGDVVRNPQ